MQERTGQQLPDIPGARRLIQVNYRIIDHFGTIQKEGTLKLNSSRWAFAEPFLLAEVIQEIGREWDEFSNPRKSRVDFTWSFLPVPHPLSTSEQGWLDWLEYQQNKQHDEE